MLAVSALIIVGIVVAVTVFVATRPSTFHIARSTTVAAPAATVFELVGDLHAWASWNPFERQDPTTTKTFEGPATGVGASFRFVGQRAGEGRMTVTELVPPRRVVVHAEFVKPFPATNRIEFAIEPAAGGVVVTWSMSGTHGFVAKAFAVLGVVDKVIGGSFENGLADIKSLAESSSSTPPSPTPRTPQPA